MPESKEKGIPRNLIIPAIAFATAMNTPLMCFPCDRLYYRSNSPKNVLYVPQVVHFNNPRAGPAP